MSNFLGTLELPLTVLAWFAVIFFSLVAFLGALIVLTDGISKYKAHKQQLKWDEIMKGVRR